MSLSIATQSANLAWMYAFLGFIFYWEIFDIGIKILLKMLVQVLVDRLDVGLCAKGSDVGLLDRFRSFLLFYHSVFVHGSEDGPSKEWHPLTSCRHRPNTRIYLPFVWSINGGKSVFF